MSATSSTNPNPKPVKFWQLDSGTRSRANEANLKANSYELVAASFKDVEKVKSIYANCPRPGFKIDSVEAIVLDDSEAAYIEVF